jgi:Mrp family chromosome partitioning ATPase
MHRLLGVEEAPGLGEALRGSTDAAAVRQTAIEHVEVFPAGSPAGELADLFASPEMIRLLDDLRARADVVLIDAPPVVPFAEVRALAAVVDGVVFVVAAGKGSREENQDALKHLERMKAHILGTVVNMVASDEDESAEAHAAHPRPPLRPKWLPATAVLLLIMVLGGAGGVLVQSAPWLPQWFDRGSQLVRALLAGGL